MRNWQLQYYHLQLKYWEKQMCLPWIFRRGQFSSWDVLQGQGFHLYGAFEQQSMTKGLLWIRVNGWWVIWNICQSTIGIEWLPRCGDFLILWPVNFLCYGLSWNPTKLIIKVIFIIMSINKTSSKFKAPSFFQALQQRWWRRGKVW